MWIGTTHVICCFVSKDTLCIADGTNSNIVCDARDIFVPLFRASDTSHCSGDAKYSRPPENCFEV